jgi:hypothetical protein
VQTRAEGDHGISSIQDEPSLKALRTIGLKRLEAAQISSEDRVAGLHLDPHQATHLVFQNDVDFLASVGTVMKESGPSMVPAELPVDLHHDKVF